jgi:serine phosphatase RsbU (regulator of sigma subunit)
MLGMNEASRFGEVEFALGKGDFLLLTSDGIIESPCSDGTQFGIPGISSFFSGYSGDAPLTDLLGEVRRRRADAPAVDDVSAVLVTPALAPGQAYPL